MPDLGTGPEPADLAPVTLSHNEFHFLIETLGIDELPTVLNAAGRHDTVAGHDAAMAAARAGLAERGLLGGPGHDELAARLRTLARPRRLLALRLVAGDTISRLALAQGAERTVLALRGPASYVLGDPGGDPAGAVAAVFGELDGLPIDGLNAPTAQLVPVFDRVTNRAAARRRLAEVAVPPRDAATIAGAMTHCHAHADISVVIYGDGTRTVADGNVAVFDTRDGRIVATTTTAADGARWTALSSGTPLRLRQAIHSLLR